MASELVMSEGPCHVERRTFMSTLEMDFGFWILDFIKIPLNKKVRRPSNHTRVQAPPAYNCPNLGKWGGERGNQYFLILVSREPGIGARGGSQRCLVNHQKKDQL